MFWWVYQLWGCMCFFYVFSCVGWVHLCKGGKKGASVIIFSHIFFTPNVLAWCFIALILPKSQPISSHTTEQLGSVSVVAIVPIQWQTRRTVVAKHRAWGKWSPGVVQVRLAGAGHACLLLPGRPLFHLVCPTFPMTQWTTPFPSNKFLVWFQSVSAPVAYN